jgi:hypothetical protein
MISARAASVLRAARHVRPMPPPRPTLLLLLLGLALGGCASEPAAELKPRGQAAVILDPAGKRTDQTVTFADLVTLTLPPAAPGRTWKIAVHDVRSLRQTTAILPPAAPGDGQTVAFLAIRSGVTRLRFVLVPDTGDRVADPVDTRDVVLTIK